MQKKNSSVQELLTGLAFPEGPLCLKDGSIWLVEKEGGNLVHLVSGKAYRYPVAGQPNGLALDKNGNIWYCDAGNNSICRFIPSNKTIEVVVSTWNNKPLNHPNDLVFDPQGNLLFTCSGNALHKNDGYVCCLAVSGKLTVLAENLNYPNGLAFRADGKKLYIAETGSTKIYVGDWDDTKLTWENATAVLETGGAVGPDGMAFDEEGNLYIAVYGAGNINVYNNNYELVNTITVEGVNPTNCAFDPSGKWGLVITEASEGKLLHLESSFRGILG